MGFFDGLNKVADKDKLASIVINDPRKIFTDILRQASGSTHVRELKYNLFYQTFAFRGVTEGVGTSTLVANVALAIATAGLTVCVIDTSIEAPVQDVLLKTVVANDVDDKSKLLDWFDMPYVRQSPLHVSKLNKNISVLSFKGKGRGIVDAVSTNDSESLVEMALTELHNKFDIILIDTCHEFTNVDATCLQMSQQVIQVWNDSETVLSNMEAFISNCITLSCPLDKMRFVVYSKLCRNAMGTLDNLCKQYRLKHIASSYMSEEVYTLLVTGKPLFQAPSNDSMVIEYTNCVLDIVCHILNIHNEPKGTITSQQILDGEVEGTYHKELKDFNEEFAENHPDIKIDNNPMGADLSKYDGVDEYENSEEVVKNTNTCENAEASLENGASINGVVNMEALEKLNKEDYDAVLPEHEELVDELKEKEESKANSSFSKSGRGHKRRHKK